MDLWKIVFVMTAVRGVISQQAQQAAQQAEAEGSLTPTKAPAFEWGSGKSLKIVALPTNEKELTSIIYAVSTAVQDQTLKNVVEEAETGKVEMLDNQYLIRQMEAQEPSELGSYSDWTPKYGILDNDQISVFATEKSFDKMRAMAENRNKKDSSEVLLFELFKQIRLHREDMRIIELHQIYILVQVTLMAILLVYRVGVMIKKRKRKSDHEKAVKSRMERLELLKILTKSNETAREAQNLSID